MTTNAGAAVQNGEVRGLHRPIGTRGGGAGARLAIGAMGVVFGDIGTSPLYALRDT